MFSLFVDSPVDFDVSQNLLSGSVPDGFWRWRALGTYSQSLHNCFCEVAVGQGRFRVFCVYSRWHRHLAVIFVQYTNIKCQLNSIPHRPSMPKNNLIRNITEFFKIHSNNLTGHLELCDGHQDDESSSAGQQEEEEAEDDENQTTIIMADCDKVECQCCITGQHGCSG